MAKSFSNPTWMPWQYSLFGTLSLTVFSIQTYLKIVDLHVDSAVVQKVDATQSSKPGTDPKSIKNKKNEGQTFHTFRRRQSSHRERPPFFWILARINDLAVDPRTRRHSPCFVQSFCPQPKGSKNYYSDTVFENHRKSLIQHCERSELRLHFEWTKVN